MEPLEGIAEADDHLGRPVPLPRAGLPLARWTEVFKHDPGQVEIAWNLDDSRVGSAGRLALFVGTTPPPPRELDDASEPQHLGAGDLTHRHAPLAEAQPSLRPVHELVWTHDGLHLRLTAQGPWVLDDLVAIAESVI